jgi:hypothetical protein
VNLNLLPLAANSKCPAYATDWRKLVTDNQREHERWLRERLNIGLPVKENRRVVVDFDGPKHVGGRELARKFYRKYRELCSCIVETAAGNIHFHFEGETKTRKIMDGDVEVGDVKGSGYVVWVGSIINGKLYRLLRDDGLQPFPEHLFPIRERTRAQIETLDEDPVRRVLRARAWIAKREKKKDGDGRGLQTIKTCRALFQMFGLTEAQVWPLILEYNERCCIPPYSLQQLRHKIEDAQK